ncbi:hypothetical protein CQ010_16940 [Arthrobacter sp. MYb211]|nr:MULTISPECIES: hypothetical protein [unclassified Arthrobacter]PQZ97192.1 hypothetical protein CQ017_14880 [Arthrobacter sp. MYb224]PRA09785.1 hypothetical protein CQ015_16925 [Arthrobacter sp. MYb221]PRC04019.1 hypothetical protein CQ010_16940 [Arthrobacter sp. MYb211]PQZ99947.1 hypothetical protein CQ019_15645 [Arthrobacter sp. MYb229]PRB48377.1 hypothetical protein CQ013_15620 [Arthrobacter sp. MYb216]
MRKSLAPIALALTVMLVGCSSAPAATDKSAETTEAQVIQEAKPADLTGEWKQVNSQSDDAFQSATVSDDMISIDWVTNNGDTKSVYWVGTFEAPAKAAESYVWTSKRDEAATDSALLASTSDTKEFTFSDEQISYEAGMMGTTTTVRLAKD